MSCIVLYCDFAENEEDEEEDRNTKTNKEYFTYLLLNFIKMRRKNGFAIDVSKDIVPFRIATAHTMRSPTIRTVQPIGNGCRHRRRT